MNFQKAIAVFISIFILVPAASALAQEEKSERWYGVFYKGKKVGRAYANFTDYKEGEFKFRKIKRKAYAKVTGTASYSGARGSASRDWTFELNAKVEGVLKDGKVIYIKVKRTGSRGPATKAKSTMENNVLVVNRREGIIKETLNIKAGDYDFTDDPSHLEPFLETMGEKAIVKKVFKLGQAEIKEVTFTRLKDSKAKDVDGVEKDCKTYKSLDDEDESILKTINGKIVYTKSMDIHDKTPIYLYWTTKQKATSDTGY